MMEKYITDERTGLKYELVGDYYLIAGDDEPEEERPIGIWGQRHLRYDDHFTLIINASKKPLSIDNIPLDDIETAFEGETGASEGCSSLNAPAPPYQKPAEMLVFPLFMRVFSIFNLCKSCCFLRSFCI